MHVYMHAHTHTHTHISTSTHTLQNFQLKETCNSVIIITKNTFTTHYNTDYSCGTGHVYNRTNFYSHIVTIPKVSAAIITPIIYMYVSAAMLILQ